MREAHTLYVRLRWMVHDLPLEHPVRPALGAALLAAYQHWQDLAAPVEDRVLDVAPARPTRNPTA